MPPMRRSARASMVGAFNQDETAKDQARVVTSNGSRMVLLGPSPSCCTASGGPQLRYAFVSQRGFYPEAPDKANQDTVATVERLGGAADAHLFAVFDGHGEFGTECAAFAQDKARVGGQGPAVVRWRRLQCTVVGSDPCPVPPATHATQAPPLSPLTLLAAHRRLCRCPPT